MKNIHGLISVPDYLRNIIALFLFPQSCILCGKNTHRGMPLCENCAETRLIRPAELFSSGSSVLHRCAKCGRPLVSCTELCTVCRNTPVLSAVDAVMTLYPYPGFGQDLLAAWKISGARSLSRIFALCLYISISHLSSATSIPVVPVPHRPGKIREKGWDQIEELARILEEMYDVPVLRCLNRTSRVQQKKLGRLARSGNLKGHIGVVESVRLPEAVIVLDDLMTTGATLDSCADALKSAGCRKVYGFTLFYD
jgi:ComF family protein